MRLEWNFWLMAETDRIKEQKKGRKLTHFFTCRGEKMWKNWLIDFIDELCKPSLNSIFCWKIDCKIVHAFFYRLISFEKFEICKKMHKLHFNHSRSIICASFFSSFHRHHTRKRYQSLFTISFSASHFLKNFILFFYYLPNDQSERRNENKIF